ncbi:hypothetical protein [Rhodococcoides fascians]|uniref:hypothetical protein n=1 Tax=Rhodococcoides fascians TaxID=1828 RepID=UPI00050D0762|nr:hypothetical protein [Rhodococcus fascians]
MPLAYFDRDGETIDPETWHRLRSDRAYRTLGSDVASIDGDKVLVSTQWMGVVVTHDSGDRANWLFDTIICTRHDETPHDGWNKRYDDLVQAIAGHSEIVDALRAGRWPA